MSDIVASSRLRFFLILFVSLSLVSSVLGWGIALQQKKIFAARIMLGEADSIGFQQQLFLTTMGSYLSDAMILSDIIRNEYDHMPTIEGAGKTVSDYFTIFARNRPYYDQIRFIDSAGMEKIRVNWNKIHKAVVVPPSQLQNKKDRAYFKNGMAFNSSIYVSKLDLNVENGMIEIPHKPMIRISHALKDRQDKVMGLLVLNLLAKSLLEQINRQGTGMVGNLYFINDKGQWIAGPSPEDAWRFMFPEKNQTSLVDQFPDAWQQIKSQKKGQFLSSSGLFSFVTIDPVDIHSAKNTRFIAVKAAESWTIVSRVPPKDLLPFWWYTVQFFLFFGQVMIVILAWYFSGIQLRRSRAMAALKENEKKLSAITNTVQDAIVLVDSKGMVLFWNLGAENIFGFSQKEIIGQDIHQFVTPLHLRSHAAKGLEAFSINGKGPFIGNVREVEAFRKDGSTFPAELNLSAILLEGQWCSVGVVRDITLRLKDRQALMENEAKFRAIFNQMFQFIGLMTPDGTLIEVNKSALDFGGAGAAQVQGVKFWDTIWWTLSQEIVDRLKASITRAAQGEFIRYEVDVVGGEGQVITIDFSITPVMDDGGNVVLLIPEGRDISERIAFEKALATREAQLKMFIRRTPAAIAMFDKEVRYLMASDRWYKDYGLDGQDIIGRSHYEIFPEIEGMEEWKAIHRKCLAGAVIKREEDAFERADGHTDWLKWEVRPWRDSDDRIGGIIMFTEVITQRKAAEAQVKELNEQLEARVSQRTRELEAAVETIAQRERVSKLLQDVASISNTALSVEEALETTLTLIAEYIDWPVGHVYMPDDQETLTLVPSPLWHLRDSEKYLGFIDATMKATFQDGEGLPGKVYSSRKVHWVEDVKQDDNFSRAHHLKKFFVRSAFGFPVITQQGVVAVLEFFTTEIYPRNNLIITMAEEVGRQLGYVIERKRVEAEVTRLAMVAQRTSNGVVITDKKGCVEWVNEGFVRISGYTLAEMVGRKPGHILQGPDTEPQTIRRIREALSKETGIMAELINYTKSGKPFWIEIDIQPVFDDAGKLVNFIAIENDISNRKATNSKLEQFKATLDQTHDAVFIFDAQTLRFTYVNNGAMNQIGYSRQEMLSMSPVDIKPDFTESQFRKRIEPLRKKETPSLSFETFHQHKNGRRIPVDILLQLVDRPGETVSFVAIVRDVTEQKRILKDLEQSRDAAQQATRAKSDFLANMSHEIRTPMNAILGMAHLLSNTDPSPRQENFINKIQAAGKGLLGIINDILDFSKIEAGQLVIEKIPFDLDSVLSGISDMVAVKAQEKGLELLFNAQENVPLSLVGDPLRIGQVLTNLANNAVKFTSEGEVVISVSAGDIINDEIPLHFVVRDSGIGMSPAQLQTLFQPFSQADASTTRKYGGTGLGLAICQQLILLMDGEIWAESEKGKGSAFHFNVKLGCLPDVEKQTFIPSADLRGMKVLVLDDNPTFQEITRQMLESFTFQVVLASTGQEAISLLEKAVAEGNPVDLVLADWKMPGMDGLEASQKIRENPLISKTPTIIMITAFGREEIMEKAELIGLDGFLIKPVNRSLLFNTIMQCLGKPAEPRKKSHINLDVDKKTFESLQGLQVLLVEDNLFNQEVAKELMEFAGVHVTVVDNGRKAVDAVAETDFDAVLMDIQMPEMDGYEAMRIIRSKETGKPRIPLIAMTANVMEADRERSRLAGADDQVDKPITPSILYAALARWTGRDGGRKEWTDSKTKHPQEGKSDLYLPLLPGLDATQGLNRFEGNRGMYARLLSRFKSEHKEMIQEIQRAATEEDNTLVERLLHTLKGLAATIGARKLAKNAKALEKQMVARERVPSEKDLFELEQKMTDVLKSIDKVVAILKPVRDPEAVLNLHTDKQHLYEQLTKLATLLKEDDYEAHTTIKELSRGSINTPLEKDIQRIRKEIEQYNYSAAIDGVEMVLKNMNLQK